MPRPPFVPQASVRQRRSPGVLAGLPLDASASATSSTSASGRAMRVNVSLLQYLDTGRWFLSVYNDDMRPQEVSLVVTEAEGVSTSCPNDCSGHGSCYLGKCDCIDGFEGTDCAKSEYLRLCSPSFKDSMQVSVRARRYLFLLMKVSKRNFVRNILLFCWC